MLLSSIFTACLRNGVTVTPPDPNRKCNLRYVLSKGDRVLTFYTNHGDDYVGHMTYNHPDTDAMTDLFMDTYYKTIKDAMHYLNPTGELVRPSRNISTTPAKPVNPDDVPNGVQVSKNEEKGGIEIRFPEKPTDNILASLHDRDFRWSRFNQVWWKKFNPADYMWAMNTFAFAKEPCSLTY